MMLFGIIKVPRASPGVLFYAVPAFIFYAPKVPVRIIAFPLK